MKKFIWKKQKEPWTSQTAIQTNTKTEPLAIPKKRAIEISRRNGRPPSNAFAGDSTALFLLEDYSAEGLSKITMVFDIHPDEEKQFRQEPSFMAAIEWMQSRNCEVNDVAEYGDNVKLVVEICFYLSFLDWYEFSTRWFYPQLVEWVRSPERKNRGTQGTPGCLADHLC